MYKGRRICVVVPAHNEEAHVAGVIRTMPSFVDHVVVVDDASTDRTAAAAGGTGDPRVEVIRHAVNQGVGKLRELRTAQREATVSADEWARREQASLSLRVSRFWPSSAGVLQTEARAQRAASFPEEC